MNCKRATHPRTLKSLQERAHKIVQLLRTANPHPRTELYFETPYQLLVSVVLSANTTDKQVNRCMEPLYKQGLVPEAVIKWGEKEFLKRIRTIGLAPTKARNVVRLTQILLDKYHGKIPDQRQDLEALPGVGRKTANVVLAEVYHQPTLAVDTHVFRVTARLGLQHEKTAEKAEQVLLTIIDPADLPAAHHWLVLHGRYTCKAINPRCDICVLAALCPSKHLFIKAAKDKAAKVALLATKARSAKPAKPLTKATAANQ